MRYRRTPSTFLRQFFLSDTQVCFNDPTHIIIAKIFKRTRQKLFKDMRLAETPSKGSVIFTDVRATLFIRYPDSVAAQNKMDVCIAFGCDAALDNSYTVYTLCTFVINYNLLLCDCF